jgi:hypothetical protein
MVMAFALTLPGRGSAEGLARESSANNVNSSVMKAPDIFKDGHSRPVLSKDCSAIGVNFTEGNGTHPGSFESKGKAANS